MNLYLVSYDKDFHLISAKKWMETDSLLDINQHIKSYHSIDSERYFPLLNNNDMYKLRSDGKTVLIFSNGGHYFLFDINSEGGKGIARDVTIEEILNG